MYYNDPFLNETSFLDEVFVCMSFFGIKEDTYFISNYGRVYSSINRRFLKPQVSTYGYYYISLGAKNRQFIHRLVAMAFVPGYSEERNCVNHIDGDKMNNYYKNLEWCTKAENNTHAYTTHLNNCVGENTRSAKLTNDQARRICELLQDGYEIYPILDIMGMERTMNNYEIIRSIRKGYAWKSISKDYNVGYTPYTRDSISDDDARKVCECFEKGMSIPETYEYVFNKKYINRAECDKYNTLSNILRKKSFKHISQNYKF